MKWFFLNDRTQFRWCLTGKNTVLNCAKRRFIGNGLRFPTLLSKNRLSIFSFFLSSCIRCLFRGRTQCLCEIQQLLFRLCSNSFFLFFLSLFRRNIRWVKIGALCLLYISEVIDWKIEAYVSSWISFLFGWWFFMFNWFCFTISYQSIKISTIFLHFLEALLGEGLHLFEPLMI